VTGKSAEKTSAEVATDSAVIVRGIIMILRGSRGQKGITGLETAIVLIAFVVVESVFAFTILSAGVFSSEANKQTIHAGLKETRAGLRQHGSAFAFAGCQGSTQAVFKIVFIVSNSLAGEPVDLTAPYSTDDSGTDPDIVNGSTAATIVSYADENQRFSDLPWSMTFIGNNNSDTLLEDGEKVEITVWLMDRATQIAIGSNSSIGFMDGSSANGGGVGGLGSADVLIVKSTRFVIELTPQLGSPLTIQRAVPPGLRNVMNLN
jgi:flagellin FlaB